MVQLVDEEPPRWEPWWERVPASGSVLFVHGRRARTRSSLKRSQKSFRWLVGLNAAFEETGRRGLLERPWRLAMPDYSEHLAEAVARRRHDQGDAGRWPVLAALGLGREDGDEGGGEWAGEMAGEEAAGARVDEEAAGADGLSRQAGTTAVRRDSPRGPLAARLSAPVELPTSDRPVLVQRCPHCTWGRLSAGLSAGIVRQVNSPRARQTMLAGVFADVGAYLADQDLQAQVRALVGEVYRSLARPVVVLSHSLGTVVAADLLTDLDDPPALLVTLGTPMSMPSLPPMLRPEVREWLSGAQLPWLNVIDPWDPVSGNRALPARPGVRNVAVRNLDRVHSEERYLSHPPVADAVVAALHDGATG